MKLLIKEFRKHEKNTLKAFCDIEILDLCLVVKDCLVHQKEGKAWVNLPQRKYEHDGEIKYADILYFSTKEAREEFRDDAVAAVKRFMEMEDEKASTPPEPIDDDIPF